MTDIVLRTPAHQHLIDARYREADLIKAVVHAYVVETRRLPFAERCNIDRRKAFATPYFPISKASRRRSSLLKSP